jgi:AcrR family transcriptional regulator
MDSNYIHDSTMSGSSDTSKRRDQILRAAERLFQHYGFAKTTVADIAREADIGVGTVYLEFSSKEAIVAELSFQRFQCVLDAMRKAASAPGSFAERFKAMFDARVKWFSQFARQGQHGMDLVHCACSASEESYRRFRSEEEELLTEFLIAAAEAGEFDVVEPRQIARILLRLYDCYHPDFIAGSGLRQARREIAAAHALLLHGLLLRPL